jgi:hypothetical protein
MDTLLFSQHEVLPAFLKSLQVSISAPLSFRNGGIRILIELHRWRDEAPRRNPQKQKATLRTGPVGATAKSGLRSAINEVRLMEKRLSSAGNAV